MMPENIFLLKGPAFQFTFIQFSLIQRCDSIYRPVAERGALPHERAIYGMIYSWRSFLAQNSNLNVDRAYEEAYPRYGEV